MCEADSTTTDIEIGGFSRGLDPDSIVGVTNRCGDSMFLIKWAGIEEVDMVLAEQAKLRIPQTVIRFYEERLRGIPTMEEKDELRGVSGHVIQNIGFQKGLQPLRIVSAWHVSGGLQFLIRWIGTDILDMVAASEANVKWPLLVIQFYERRIIWNPADDNISDDDDYEIEYLEFDEDSDRKE